MGLFSLLRSQRAVIEWTAPDEPAIVHAHSQDNMGVRSGTKLVVRDGQCAALVARGQVADVFGPGQYVLDPDNLPLLAAMMNGEAEWPSALESALFFVLTERFADLPWHVSTSLEKVKETGDGESGTVEGGTVDAGIGESGIGEENGLGKTILRAKGVYAVQVVDAGKLLAHIFEANQIYETAYLLGSLRGQIGIALAGICGEEAVTEHTDFAQLASQLENRLQPSFEAMGLALSGIRIDELAMMEEASPVQESGIVAPTAAPVHFADKAVHVTEAERLMLVSNEQRPSKRRPNF